MKYGARVVRGCVCTPRNARFWVRCCLDRR